MKTYTDRLKVLNERYNPDKAPAVEQRFFSDLYQVDRDVVKYVMSAMRAVDDEYTQKTKDAGNNAKTYLNSVVDNVVFEYQGSVMTDTHIRGVSDIDLLTICNLYEGTEIQKVRDELQNHAYAYSYEEKQRLVAFENAFNHYKGNPADDLKRLREQCEKALLQRYSICDVTKPKSIKIKNTHFNRDVDIVIASMQKSFNYVRYGNLKKYLGIQIYNKALNCEEKVDYPFLSIDRINTRSAETNGRLKRMIRFLKNVKADAEYEIKLSSFDINALCYYIPVEEYKMLDSLNLVSLLWHKMFTYLTDNTCNEIKAVNDTEYIFRNNSEKIEALRKLKDEVWQVYCDINKK